MAEGPEYQPGVSYERQHGHEHAADGLDPIPGLGEGGGGAVALDDLTDVTIVAPALRHVLVRDATGWTNRLLTLADFPAALATGATVDAAILLHAGDPNAHGDFLTQTEGDARYETPAGAQAKVDAHAGGTGAHVSTSTPSNADAPSTYPIGVSYHQGLAANGFPVAGPLLTVKQTTTFAMQYLVDRTTGVLRVRSSQSSGDTWNAWTTFVAGDDARLSDARTPTSHQHPFSEITGTATDAQIPAAITRDSELAAAIVAHEALANPHGQYLTQDEGDARYAPVGGGGSGEPARLHVQFQAAGTYIFTNLGATLTELSGSSARRSIADLIPFTQARLAVVVSTLGATGVLRAQYSIDGTTWNYLNGATGPEVSLAGGTAGVPRASGWVNIAAAAQIENCMLRIIAINGNGTEDPAVANVALELK